MGRSRPVQQAANPLHETGLAGRRYARWIPALGRALNIVALPVLALVALSSIPGARAVNTEPAIDCQELCGGIESTLGKILCYAGCVVANITMGFSN